MPTDAFSSVRAANAEVHTSPTYYWENTRRPKEVWDVLTVQWTLGGAGFFRDARDERKVPAGYALLFTHHEPTAYGYPSGATEPYRLRFMQFMPAPSIVPLFVQLRRDFGSIVAMPEQSEPGELFNELYTRNLRRTFRDRFHESELIYRFFATLYREQVLETKASDPIEYGFHYVQNHFRSPVNLKTISAKCGVSREHFIREFSSRYGEPPGTLLRRLRLEHANAMLDATQLTIEEVALSSGFTSANSFGRAYRQRFGASPRLSHPLAP